MTEWSRVEALADALNLLAGIIESNKDRIGYMSGSAVDKYVKKARTLAAQAVAPAQAVVDSMAQERKAPGAPVLPVLPDGWKLVANGCVIEVTAPDGMRWCIVENEDERATKIGAFFHSLCKALLAALSKQVPAEDAVLTALHEACVS